MEYQDQEKHIIALINMEEIKYIDMYIQQQEYGLMDMIQYYTIHY